MFSVRGANNAASVMNTMTLHTAMNSSPQGTFMAVKIFSARGVPTGSRCTSTMLG